MNTKNLKKALVCGMLGCLCYGGGDWLMMYGDPTYNGTLKWLTTGTSAIAGWRYNLAMALAFPGIILYGIALFAVGGCIRSHKEQKIYHYLNAFGLTPWIALHLFYIMILTLFAWMNGNGYASESLPVCEGLFSQLSWFIPISEALMLPVFLYWFYLQIRGKTVFPRWMAFTNVLVIFALLKGISLLMPVSAFRLGFTNGLMSESMIIWFGIILFSGGLCAGSMDLHPAPNVKRTFNEDGGRYNGIDREFLCKTVDYGYHFKGFLIGCIYTTLTSLIFAELYGQEYTEYKQRVNRCIPWMPKR